MAILKVLYALLAVYVLLLSLRIVLSWFRVGSYGGPWDLLVRVTEPWLAAFRGIRFLRQGALDFTPIAAILALVVAMDILNVLIGFGRITLGFVLGSIVSAVWGVVAFILLLFLIVGVVRLVLLLVARPGSPSGFLAQALDTMLQPVVRVTERLLPSPRSFSRLGYPHVLTIALVGILVIRLAGSLLVMPLVVRLLRSLPI